MYVSRVFVGNKTIIIWLLFQVRIAGKMIKIHYKSCTQYIIFVTTFPASGWLDGEKDDDDDDDYLYYTITIGRTQA